MAKGRNQGARSRKRIEQLVGELLDKCLQFCSDAKTPQALLDEHKELSSIVGNLIALEPDVDGFLPKRAAHIAKFVEWCEANGVVCENLEIVPVNESGDEFGIKTKVKIERNELILEIPRKLMITSETATEDPKLFDFVTVDPMLKSMPNVVLALHVIEEHCKEQSFWKPYLAVLPSKYVTPLYFTSEEMNLLKCSPALEEAVKLFKSICRQYAYFWKLIHSSQSPASKLALREHFTFNFYRWAISAVMTRLNFIPSKDESHMVNALIPLWDFCNHANGPHSTDYDVEKNHAVCYAMKDFLAGEEVKIFYGIRSNVEFLVHNGFVCEDNENDYVLMKLGISKNDPSYELKLKLCSKAKICLPKKFILKPKGKDVNKELLIFLRVFHMGKEDLESWLSRDAELLGDIGNPELEEIDRRTTLFLSTRCKLLLKNYPENCEVGPLLLTIKCKLSLLRIRTPRLESALKS